MGGAHRSNLIEGAAASACEVAMSKKRLKYIHAEGRPAEKRKNHLGVV
jgi:hypothetical protein